MEQSKEAEPEQERCLEVDYSEIKDQLTADNLLGSGAFGSGGVTSLLVDGS